MQSHSIDTTTPKEGGGEEGRERGGENSSTLHAVISFVPLLLTSLPGHSQIFSRSCGEKMIFLHSCEIKSRSGLGTILYDILQLHWWMIASSHVIVIADMWSSMKIVETYAHVVLPVVCNQMYLYHFIVIGGEINDENHKVSEVNI